MSGRGNGSDSGGDSGNRVRTSHNQNGEGLDDLAVTGGSGVENLQRQHRMEGQGDRNKRDRDRVNLAVEGGVPLEGVGTSQDVVPDQLLESRKHFDDDPRYALRRRITQMHGDHMLPRACLLNHVVERGLCRPVHNVEQNGASRR